MDWIEQKTIMYKEHARNYSPRKHFKMFLWKQISEMTFDFFFMIVSHKVYFFSSIVFSAYENLIELGIFKNLKAFIDTDKSGSASQYGYTVSFEGDELSRITGTIGTEIGQNDGALTAELVSPNVFGRGERMSINYSYSYIKATELNLKFLKPFYHTNVGDYKPEYVKLRN